MGKNFTPTDFISALAANAVPAATVLEGLVKPSGAEDALYFSEGRTCEQWTRIPVELLDEVEVLQTLRCHDHNHPLVRLHLRRGGEHSLPGLEVGALARNGYLQGSQSVTAHVPIKVIGAVDDDFGSEAGGASPLSSAAEADSAGAVTGIGSPASTNETGNVSADANGPDTPLGLAAANRYALAAVRNATNFNLNYRARWGAGAWSPQTLAAGATHIWNYQYPSGTQASPALFLSWDEDMSNVNRSRSVVVKRFAGPTIDAQFAARYEFHYQSTGNVVSLYSVNGEILPADWTQVARFYFGTWEAEMLVGEVRVIRIIRPDNGWTYRVDIDTTLGFTGCGPGQHRTGRVRARISGSSGGFLDTGDLNVHSGAGTKSQTFDPANPGALTQCQVWRSTWCEF
jgi:hypothetical protein